MVEDDIPYKLIIAHLEGISSKEEYNALEYWLQKNERNLKIFAELKNIWQHKNEFQHNNKVAYKVVFMRYATNKKTKLFLLTFSVFLLFVLYFIYKD